MTNPTTPDGVRWDCSEYGIAVLLLAQFKAALDEGGAPVARTVVHPGMSVPGYAELGAGSGVDLAWTRVGTVTPIETKHPDLGQVAYAVQVELGAYRCYTVPAQNRMPDDATLDWHARRAIDDAARMRDAVRALHTVSGLKVWPGEYTPVPTRGGLHGGRMLCRVHALLGGYPDGVIPPIGAGGA